MKSCVLCTIDKQALIYASKDWYVIEVNDAEFPGYVRVIWRAHVAEMTDLSPEERQLLMQVVWIAEQAVRDVMQPDKVNLATLGNMVPHMHWHVIARYATDTKFPESIWGAPQRARDESKLAQLKEKQKELVRVLKQRLVERFGPEQAV